MTDLSATSVVGPTIRHHSFDAVAPSLIVRPFYDNSGHKTGNTFLIDGRQRNPACT